MFGSINRRDQHIKPIMVTPMEDNKVNADPNEIDDYYEELEQLIADLPAALDEMENSEYS